jgi:hypothetical protein
LAQTFTIERNGRFASNEAECLGDVKKFEFAIHLRLARDWWPGKQSNLVKPQQCWRMAAPKTADADSADENSIAHEPNWMSAMVGLQLDFWHYVAVVSWIQALIWAFKPTDVVDIRYLPGDVRRETEAMEGSHSGRSDHRSILNARRRDERARPLVGVVFRGRRRERSVAGLDRGLVRETSCLRSR